MTDRTESDAAAMVRSDEEWNHLFNLLRTENARLAADLAATRQERDAARDIGRMLAEPYTEAEGVKEQLAAARQEAADWRTLLACGSASAQYLAACVAKAEEPDYRQMIWRHYEALLRVPGVSYEVRVSAYRLAATHLNPAAEGGGK